MGVVAAAAFTQVLGNRAKVTDVPQARNLVQKMPIDMRNSCLVGKLGPER